MAAERDITIAQLEQSIADADADLATSLLQFDQSRALNIEFWTKISDTARRILRR